MSELIIVKPEKCVGCNACVRACPAPEANITRMIEGGKFITSINPDRCIGCGACVVSCNHGARDYIDDTDECMNRMKRDKMIVLVSSSIKSVFPTKWKGILDWFRKQGCIIYDGIRRRYLHMGSSESDRAEEGRKYHHSAMFCYS